MKYIRKIGDKKIVTYWRTPDEIDSDKPITQASGICFNKEGKILIVRSGKDWILPGGHPEVDEDIFETLRREVWEEASVKIDSLSLLGFSEVFFPDNPNKDEGDHFYQARFVALISEIEEMHVDSATGKLFERKFVTPQEFLEHINWQDAKYLLELSIKNLGKIK
jgi:8-oxo-dGTP pyrophosphatase MutT (NUDIX family)